MRHRILVKRDSVFRILFVGITRKAINLQIALPFYSHENFLTTDKPVAQPEKKAIFRPHTLHANWHPMSYTVDGTHHVVYEVPAQGKTRADILFMSGCGSDSLYFPRQINRDFSANGIRTLATQQVHKSEYYDNIKRNVRYTEWLLLDQSSPVHQRDKSVPLFVVNNSSTAMLMKRLSTDRDNADIINQNVVYSFSTAPFYDTARTALIHKFQDASLARRMLCNAIVSPIYGAYSWWQKDTVIGDGPIDKLIMRVLGSHKTIEGMKASIAYATHGEGREYRKLGRDLIKEFERIVKEEPDHPALRAHETEYRGIKDSAADPYSAEHLRYLSNMHQGETSRVFHASAEHNPLKQDPAVIADILETIADYVGDKEEWMFQQSLLPENV